MQNKKTNKKTNITKEVNSRKKRRRKLGRRIKIALQLITIVILLSITGGIFYFYHTYGNTIIELQMDAREKVNASTPDTFKASQTSLVYDAKGKVISTLKASKDVYYVDYNDIPQAFIDSMVATEDRKF
ncbi:MAG TPA: hypothetical protein VN131_04690, partial [Mobilitalea sp.]|nr:hypothetical protein [Mobilitalea sp.]